MSTNVPVVPVAGGTLLRAFLSLLAFVTRWLKDFARARRHRREARVLAGLDRRMLADIGVTRADLRDAFSEPFWEDPTALLRERVGERRANRVARARAVEPRLPPPAHRPPGAPGAAESTSRKRPIPLIGRDPKPANIPSREPDPAPAGPSGGRILFYCKLFNAVATGDRPLDAHAQSVLCAVLAICATMVGGALDHGHSFGSGWRACGFLSSSWCGGLAHPRRCRDPRKPRSAYDRPGNDYLQLHRPLRRSGGLRRALRARRTLPRLELLLSAHQAEARHLLAEEEVAAARAGRLLRFRRARRRRDRAAARADRIFHRPSRRRLQHLQHHRRSGRRALPNRPARRTAAAAPGPMCGPAISALPRAAISKAKSRARTASRAAFRAWCGSTSSLPSRRASGVTCAIPGDPSFRGANGCAGQARA